EGKNLVNLFAIRDKQGPSDYRNKPGKYFILEVGNKSGNINVTYWGGANEEKILSLHNDLQIGDIVKISGQTRFDTRKKQLAIHINEEPRYGAPQGYIKKVDPTKVDVSEFLPTVDRDIEKMYNELKSYIKEVQNPSLKSLLTVFFEDEDFVLKFKRAPAAKSKHHNYIGGLLEHNLGVIRLCSNICEYYPSLDRDLLIAGAILHDIGKIPEYKLSASIDFSNEGMLVGHIVLGSKMVSDAINGIEGFPENLRLKLLHMVVSHHGRLEYGSPVSPKFPEAVALHHADFQDSNVKNILQKIDESGDIEGDWTYIRDGDNSGYIYLK
ncbi:MAG: 3'-5' exoribonuclease YhaM family protein, partial [Candidatus Hydrothermarchaeales archaeon]